VLFTENERRGKAHAVNLALGNCSGEILVITDGPPGGLYDKDTLYHLVAPFTDPRIGGVPALYKVPNSNENQITASEKTFWTYKEKLRALESKAYSTSWLSGEACSFRSGFINQVDDDSLAEDSIVALRLVTKGYRVIVNPNSHFIEKSPSQINDFLRVKVRRALGGLQEGVRFRFLLFNRGFGHFGLVIFPYRFSARS
jgi:poly-beta-1,6-N-acetyl-D-glucosamine synthase